MELFFVRIRIFRIDGFSGYGLGSPYGALYGSMTECYRPFAPLGQLQNGHTL